MKFHISTPCEFPRLKFNLFDYGLTGDEALGESTINIKNTIKLMQKQGEIEDKKVWISFKNPNKKDSNVGYALVSLNIISLQEAE